MGEVYQLAKVQQRISRGGVRAAKAALSNIPDEDLTPQERLILYGLMDKVAAREARNALWPGGYSMISLAQIGRVWNAIRALPAKQRPQDVRFAFDLVLQHLHPDTGRVLLTRSQFADEMGKPLNVVSQALSVLVRMEVLRRERVPVDGLRGPGVAIYSINENVAWNGDLDIRKAQAAKRRPPALLQLMEGARQRWMRPEPFPTSPSGAPAI